MKTLGLLLLLLLGAAGAFLVYVLGAEHVVQVTDNGFVLRSAQPSPDGRHVILTYQFDGGGMGTSRPQWAIVPADYEQLNLVEYGLPEPYRPAGWRSTGGLVVEEWKPYHTFKEGEALATGDVLHGVPIHVTTVLPASQSSVW